MIEWNEKYNLNMAVIDEDHKKLFEIINKAITARENSNDPEEISKILQEMNDYAEKHFKTEREYMAKHDYPEMHSHNKEHLDFCIKVLDYDVRLNRDYDDIIEDLIEYLRTWLIDHIQKADRKYVEYFKKNGFKQP